MTDEGGVWRTISGRRVFIKDGQSVSDAMKASGKFKKAGRENHKKESEDDFILHDDIKWPEEGATYNNPSGWRVKVEKYPGSGKVAYKLINKAGKPGETKLATLWSFKKYIREHNYKEEK